MLQTATGTPALDVCKACQLVWFDPSEFENAPPSATATSTRLDLPEDQIEVIARAQAQEIAREWRNRPDTEISAEDLLLIPAALGMPLEEQAPEVRTLPWVTWSLAFAVIIFAIFSLGTPRWVSEWGLVPVDAFRRGGITFLTYFFIHGSWFHLAANVYFLMVFGDNVEDFLGRINYVLLVFVGAIAGAAVHALFSPARMAPLVGASAGISGVILFYGLRFPQARLRYFRLFRWFSMPALAATGFWVVTQILGARDQLSGTGDVSFLSHLGGAAIGLWFWFLWRND